MSTPAPASDERPAADPPSLLSLLDTIRNLRRSSGALFDQLLLYTDLVRVEWAEEKRRLQQMLLTSLLGLAFLHCSLLATGALVMALAWDSAWRIPSALLLLALYLIGFGIAWARLSALSARSSQAFAATREELSADVELLRSKL